ncbi:21856_t:CDS:2 [Gigaspora margarita]|uniref:Uncharacterized protein n=2 Tax=Gigaspora margarita TaxID=4874 RepID=A0A8H4AMM1_GIGMA|nr:hypothetical protein F8M41_017717 [Gigaspora margarita]CAG8695332.1 21856_t:CDS:2 [Gigaspora margarita]
MENSEGRKRAAEACQSCRKLKKKCERGQNSCKRCLENNKECSFNTEQTSNVETVLPRGIPSQAICFVLDQYGQPLFHTNVDLAYWMLLLVPTSNDYQDGFFAQHHYETPPDFLGNGMYNQHLA